MDMSTAIFWVAKEMIPFAIRAGYRASLVLQRAFTRSLGQEMEWKAKNYFKDWSRRGVRTMMVPMKKSVRSLEE